MMIAVEEEAELSSWLGRTFFFFLIGPDGSSDEPESSAQRTS
jgi:hypothetical protein